MSFKAFVWAWDQDVPNGDHHHVLLALANIAPSREVRASVPYIAKQVRRSVRKVRAAIGWLADAGLITVTERPGLVDAIRLNIPADFRVLMPDEDDDLELGERGRPRRKTPSSLGLNPAHNPYPRGDDEPGEPLEPGNDGLRAPDPFEEWWVCYPRKAAKKEARKAWAQMATEIATLTLAVLMDRTRAFAGSVINKDPEHIAHAATWLRGERWNDELPTHRSQTDGQPTRNTAGADRGADRTARVIAPMVEGARQALDRRRRWTLGG